MHYFVEIFILIWKN